MLGGMSTKRQLDYYTTHSTYIINLVKYKISPQISSVHIIVYQITSVSIVESR